MNTFSHFIVHIIRGELSVQEASQVAYGEPFDQFPDEKELLKAHLLVELIERYKYPLEAITVDAYISVGRGGVSYAPIDIVVRNRPGNPVMLIAVEPFDAYKEKLQENIRRLFAAAVLMREKAPPRFLVYYTRWYVGAVRKTSQVVVDYGAYQTYDAWNQAQRPTLVDIPSNV